MYKVLTIIEFAWKRFSSVGFGEQEDEDEDDDLPLAELAARISRSDE